MPRDARGLLRWGVIANLVLAAALSTAWACSQPMFGLADETANFDYAYQVWKGHLPVFEDGLLLTPPFGVRPPVQWTAQHPPLFYLIQAPFIGPLVDADRLLAAGYAGRAVNTAITVALVAAVMWAASAIAPARRSLWLAAGTVAACYPLVIRVGGEIFNDNLLALWSALLVGLTALILRRGPTPRRLIIFAVVAACALLTRLAGAPVSAVCGGVLGVALLLLRPRPWRSIAGLIGAGAFAGLASGWFYLRNLRLTGNLAGGHFDYLTHRVKRSFSEVVTRNEVWEQLLAIHGYQLLDPVLTSILLAGLPVAAACVLGLRRLLQRPVVQADRALAVLLVGLVATVVLMQLSYVGAGGGASMRYLGPLTVVVAYAVAAGLTANRRAAPLLLSLWAALEFLTFAIFVLTSAVRPDPALGTAPVFPLATASAVLVAATALAVALGTQFALARRRGDASGSGRVGDVRFVASTAPEDRG
jgi:hypothetical protein